MRTPSPTLHARCSRLRHGTFALLLLGMVSGCAAPRAVLYTEGSAGRQAHAQRALHSCESKARRAVDYNAGSRAIGRQAGSVGTVAAVSAISGALVKGARDLTGPVLVAGTAGVAGALTKGVIGHNQPDEVYERYVKLCMKKRGHEVLGWR